MTQTQQAKHLLVNGEPIAYESVPVGYMADGLRLYFERGIPPGSFMLAVLAGDLFAACSKADNTNRYFIWDWAKWFYNHAPAGSYGSPERVKEWIDAKAEGR